MRFKKHISIILAFFLLVSNVGLAFDVHYCGEKVASIQPFYLKSGEVLNSVEKGCCEKKVSKKDSCCKNKVVHFQKKSDNVLIKAFSLNADIPFLIKEWNPIVFSKVTVFKNFENNSYYCDAHSPPLFKLYSQYIFYA
ncbi:HYC_CC_PP family protein [Flavobacterium sp. ZT3R17]|uniref:HYC_CC_PP family protein n=1 Tax=Flavobacterium cryoconiti TaxID=3398736 RepID=UPI003A83EB31